MKPLKCVVVGDSGVGKTCLLTVYAQSHFPETYVPTIRDNFIMKVVSGDQVYELELFDTAGQEEYEKLRPLSYPGTDVFLVCFSLIDKEYIDNVTNKWIPELNHFNSKAHKILVGTKLDIRRQDFPDDETVDLGSSKCVSFKKGKELQKKIKAADYFEVSAKTRENIDDLFTKAVAIAGNPSKHRQRVCKIF